MSFTSDDFRAAFTAFGDKDVFPGATIDFWSSVGYQMHNADRYGTLLDQAVMLFVAHNLSLEFDAKAAAASGQNPGKVIGALTSASVDKVSYSRDQSSAMDPKNGHWNLSSYGLRWVTLRNMMGMGGFQVGAGCDDLTNASASAWPGPFPSNW